jgi:hypothetical protein
MTKHFVKSTATALIAIISMLLLATTLGQALAAPTTVVSGQGKGSVTCADGSGNNDAHITIDAKRDKGNKIAGNWEITTGSYDTNDFSYKGGNVYGGKIGKNSFTLQVVEQYHIGPTCSQDPIPAKGTISGACAIGSTVDVRVESGEHGSFTTNVVCHP